MKLLYLTTDDLQTGGNIVRMKVETDGATIYVTADRFPRNTLVYGGVALNITYNGETKRMESQPLSKMQVSFPYIEEIKEIRVDGENLYYDGVEYGDFITFSWKGKYSDPTPSVNVFFDGIRHESRFTLSFTYNNQGGYYIYPVAIYANTWNSTYNQWSRLTYLSGKSTKTSISETFSSNYNNRSKIEFYIYFAMYKKATDAEGDYIGIYEYVSPIYSITSKGTPYAPHDLSCGEIVAGYGCTLTWNRVTDTAFPSVQYELQRSLNGGEYEDIYFGAEKLFNDFIPDKTRTVHYRVRAVSGDKASAWCDGDEINLVKCNAFIGVNGVIRPGVAVYVGVNGKPVETQGEFIVG